MLPLIPIAMGLAQAAGALAPTIAGWLGGDKAADVAEKVVSVANVVTGVSDAATSMAMIQADPAKAIEFQRALLASQAELARIANEVELAEIAADTAALATVNQTMQREATSERWPQWSWRPAVGFTFAAYIASLFVLPVFSVKPERLSEFEVMAVLAVLGVASWGRSMLSKWKAK